MIAEGKEGHPIPSDDGLTNWSDMPTELICERSDAGNCDGTRSRFVVVKHPLLLCSNTAELSVLSSAFAEPTYIMSVTQLHLIASTSTLL